MSADEPLLPLEDCGRQVHLKKGDRVIVQLLPWGDQPGTVIGPCTTEGWRMVRVQLATGEISVHSSRIQPAEET